MVTRTRKTTAAAVATTSAVSSLLLITMAAISLATFGPLVAVEGAFHDGITGSSLRSNNIKNKNNNSNSNGNSNSNTNFQANFSKQARWSRSHQQEKREQQHQHSRNLQDFDGTSTSARESCEAARAREEADISPGGRSSSCKCEQTVMDERYAAFINIEDQPIVFTLTCVDQRCSYCSPDGSTCDRFSYGAAFEEVTLREGAIIKDAVAQVGYFETNQYIVGRDEAVVYTEYNDPTAPGKHACSMEIDGLECAVCEYINCVGNGNGNGDRDTNSNAREEVDVYYGLNVVCSNILLGDGQGGTVAASDFETCDPEQIEAIGESQGVFEMYDPDYGQCFTSLQGCDRDKLELEQTGYYSCGCQNGGLPNDGISPYLENVQLKCQKTATGIATTGESNEICKTLQKDTIERGYSSYVTETTARTLTLENGSTLTIEEFGCQNTMGASDGCSECKASIDDVECSSCEMAACGTGVLAPQISCSNASRDLSQSLNLCQSESVQGTPFEAFHECGFGEAAKIPNIVAPTLPPTQAPRQPDPVRQPIPGPGMDPVSMLACRGMQNEFTQRTNNIIDSQVLTCECYLIDEGVVDAGTLLECTSNGGACGSINGGSVCNALYDNSGGSDNNGGVCFKEGLVLGFLPDGSKTPMTRTTTYTLGNTSGGPENENSSTTEMTGRTLVLTEYGNGSKGCELLVDGEKCNSCTLENCGGNLGTRPLVDCSNVSSNTADSDSDSTNSYKMDTCDAVARYTRGFLLRLAAGADALSSSNFQTCSEQDFSDRVYFENDGSDGSDRDGDGDGDSSGSGGGDDRSLPATCSRAQPVALLAQRDNPIDDIAVTRDVTNPNSNFAFASFVSSTEGLTQENNAMKESESCAGEGSDSPGLWYSLVGSGKGVHASVCREATDFEARISVYEGSCGESNDNNNNVFTGTDLSCVTGTTPVGAEDRFGSPCDTHWVAEEGVTYHLRVHGSSSSEAGTFNLFLENLADDVTTTCYSDETKEFDQACLACAKTKAERIQQFSGDPSEIDCRCLENPATLGYHLTCVDLSCLKCNPRGDTCGFDTFELEIQRKANSISASATNSASTLELQGSGYESFYFMNKADGIQASEIATIQNTECLEIKDPYQECMSALEETTTAAEDQVFCECRGTSEEGDYMLLCSLYNTYEYCASASGDGGSDSDVCASVLFGQSFNQYGLVTDGFRNYNIKTEDTSDESKSSITIERTENECFVSINEETCSKCEILQTCVTNGSIGENDLLKIANSDSDSGVFTDLLVDCSNIVEGGVSATFECGSAGGEGSNSGSINPLSILAGSVGLTKDRIVLDGPDDIPNDQQTIPPNAFPPTTPPVTKPTSPPIEPTGSPSKAPAVAVADEDGSESESEIDSTSTVIEDPDVGERVPIGNNTTDVDSNATDDNSSKVSSARGLTERRTVACFASVVALAASVF